VFRSPFTLDWARYAGIVGGRIVLWLFWAFMFSALLLTLSAVASGRLYVGNQVFRRMPLTGWAARSVGLLITGLVLFNMWFFYGLLHFHRH
jgi:hypothetical protein